MQIIEKIMQKIGYAKQTPRRDYDIARIDRLTAGFRAPITTADVELRASLSTARARARELERNNDYARKFLKMCEINVVGRNGFILQNKSHDPGGKLDRVANDQIENEFWAWSKRGNCTVDGKYSFLGVQKLFIHSVARDGEFLARLIRGHKGNPWRFALQILEPDILNETHNVPASDRQNKISMGIEYDAWGRPVYYHLRKKHPGDGYGAGDYERVPAGEILHAYMTDRATQGRGMTWLHTAARRLNQIGEYEYAEVVAARLGASKMGFYEKTDPTGLGQYVGDEQDAAGNPISHAEAGAFEVLPAGYKFSSFLPEHPTAQYGAFIKSSLRGAAAGLGVSYNSLANDLEGVNFSSMRVGSIEERDHWKTIQAWMIEDFLNPVYEAWLAMLLMSDRSKLPFSKFDKFNAPDWRSRTFDWVDPEKDINAELACVRARWKTERQVVMERFGMDLEDLYEQISADNKLKEKYGITSDFGETVGKLKLSAAASDNPSEPQEGGNSNAAQED
jgi:lambda family phage portal protein